MCGETIHAGVVQFDARPESACRGDPRNNKDPSGGVFARLVRPALCAALAAPHLLHPRIVLRCTHCAAQCANAKRRCERLCTATSAMHLPHRNKCKCEACCAAQCANANVKQGERQAGRTPARAPQRGVANDATRGSSEEKGEERHSIRITYYSSYPCSHPQEYPSRVRNGQCSRSGIDAYSSYCNSSNIEQPSEYPSRVTASLAFRAWRIMRQRVTLTPAPTRAHAGEKRTTRRMRRICDSLSHSRTPHPVV